MNHQINIDLGKEEMEVNRAATEWVEYAILKAPFEFRLNQDKVLLAIPTTIQKMLLSYFRSRNMQGLYVSKNDTTIFLNLFGYKVVPGYEMAIVLYFEDAVNDPEKLIYKVPFSLVFTE